MHAPWATFALVFAAACSAPERPVAEGFALLRAHDVPAAVQASGARMFTEINVGVDGVTMFVVDGATERSVTYATGKLGDSSPPAPLEGTPFDASRVRLDVGAELVKRVEQQFPGSRVTAVALLEVPPNGLVWGLRSRSAKGGLLNLLFTPDGAPLSAVPT